MAWGCEVTERTIRLREQPDELAGWEKLPAVALGISQGLNIFLWYIMSLERVALQGHTAMRVPDFVITFLPFAVFIAAIAAAVSLDGTMIATIGGSRNQRDGVWTWVSVGAAALFSAGIALDVYGGSILPGAWLHIAQTAVLFCYMMHLRQRRKPFTSPAGTQSHLEPVARDLVLARTGDRVIPAQEDYPAPEKVDLTDNGRLRACKFCGEMLPISRLGSHGRNYKRFGSCVKL